MFSKLFTAVDGHKTDIIAGAALVGAVVAWVGVVVGWWTYEQLEKLPEIAATVVVPLLAMGFRDAMRKE